MTHTEILAELRSLSSPSVKASQARFGIDTSTSIGVSAPKLKALAKRVGRDHSLALRLWGTGIHEARMLASLIDEPAKVTKIQMDRWAKDFDSWDVNGSHSLGRGLSRIASSRTSRFVGVGSGSDPAN